MKQYLLSLLIVSGVLAIIFGTLNVAASGENLISYWNLDETSGTTFADSVGPNDATCSNCPATTTGIVNDALLFDGTNDGLNVTDDPSLNWTADDSFSIVAWIKGTPNCSGNKVIIGKRRSTVIERADWWLGCGDDSGNSVAKFFLRDSNSNIETIIGTTTISDNNWHQLIATWDANSDEIELYVDGVEEASTTFAFTGTFSNTGALTMGYYDNSFFFAGVIDEVKLYNVAVIPTLVTSTPVEAAVVNQPYTYTVTADGSPVPTFSLSQFPAGMTIDSNTGVISWTPTSAGSFDVEVEASNEIRTETQSFTIEVIDVMVTKSLVSQLPNSGGTAEFSIAITNTSSVALDLTVEDLLEETCVDNLNQNTLAAGESTSYQCATPNVEADFTNVITVTGTYTPTTGSPVAVVASDSAFVDVLPTIELSQSLQPASLPEPGGPVTVSLTITNPGQDPVTLTSLTATPFGDVTDAGNGAITSTTCVTGTIAGGADYACSFSVNSAAQPGQYDVVTTAVAQDSTGNEANDEATSTVTVTNVPSSIAVAVTADPTSIPSPGGAITFLVEVTNTSSVDSVVINSLSDQLLGSLDGEGTCSLPTASILPGGKYECSFTAAVSGAPGEDISNQVSASGSDDDGVLVSDEGVATVTIQSFVFLPFVSVGN